MFGGSVRLHRSWCRRIVMIGVVLSLTTGVGRPSVHAEDMRSCLDLGFAHEIFGLQEYEAPLNDALAPFGLCVYSIPLPYNRHVRLMRRGDLDGDLARVWGMQNVVPGLIRIPIPIDRIPVQILTSHPGVRSADDLARVRVGVPRVGRRLDGTILVNGYEARPRKYVLPGSLTTTETEEDLIDILASGRVDAVIALSTTHDLDSRSAQFRRIHLYDAVLYTYLTAENRDAVPAFTAALSQMQARQGLEKGQK